LSPVGITRVLPAHVEYACRILSSFYSYLVLYMPSTQGTQVKGLSS
jgi:hypothetical protein